MLTVGACSRPQGVTLAQHQLTTIARTTKDVTMEIRLASREDVETLVQLRMDFRNEMHPSTDAEAAAFDAQFRAYLAARLDTGRLAGILGFVGGEIASGAFLLVDDYPASCMIPHGRKGTLIYVYTYPAYRRRGYGRQIVDAAIAQGRELGLDVIDLDATDMGRGVYAQAGFEVREITPMRIVL